jgi:colanic acid biosynthesis glycosyl transferase WcaI
MSERTSLRLLIISQVYVPDPTAVGQHIADVSEEMVRRGWEVHVITSSRAYDDPSIKFPAREIREGVHVRRLPLSSFGKRSIAIRLLAQSLFMVQAVIHGILMPRVAVVVVSTSPPFAGFGGAVISLVRRVPFLWWVMDLNPDQMVAAGKLQPTSIFVRVFDWMNRVTLRRAARVVALDSYMADRLNRKVDVSAKTEVMPPWPHAEPPVSTDAGACRFVDAGQSFRRQHGWQDRFVVMYSGNHAIQHPLDTLLAAAARMSADRRLLFAFVGGGAGKAQVEREIGAGASNVVSLPYQPLETLEESLGAADLHVVSMGAEVVGIVHPCKIYGAMAVGRPVLFFGPRESHAGEILQLRRIGWRVDHGDVQGAIAAIHEAASMPRPARLAMGITAAGVISGQFSKRDLLLRLCNLIEGAGTPPA